MLDIYKQFRDFHIFKKFKYLLGDWWNVDILVIVKRGDNFLYDNVKQLSNPVVRLLLESALFKNYFLGSLNKLIQQKKSNTPGALVLPWKQTGLQLFVVPLIKKGAPLEAFFVATGFAPKKKKELRQSLLYAGLSEKAIDQHMEKLKFLSATDEVYIQRMLKILAEEFFALLQEKQSKDHIIETLHRRGSPQGKGPLVGQSPAIKYLFKVLEKIKNYDSSLLIEGEFGTGKRLLAKVIHSQSSRAKMPFYIKNFSSFRGSFSELEFFGCVPGFLPKIKLGKKSLLKKAEGGAILLNEIENTSLKFQKKLLGFLKKGIYFVEGDDSSLQKANVRIMASTSKNLKELVEKGEFDEELYFALSVMSIQNPSLKQRKEDIPLLAQHFLEQERPSQKAVFSQKALSSFYNYSWPGNIRELKNEIEKMVYLSPKNKNVFTEVEVSSHIRNASSSFANIIKPGKKNLKEILQSIEKQILLDCLRQNNWNKTKAAQVLGTSRTSIVLKSKEYGILKKQGA